ncbi:MAG: hypothetical protein L0229_21205, partial [Blastocatellia bacterium]|nr:hypothetical protein [Blastocatellia bacterium]
SYQLSAISLQITAKSFEPQITRRSGGAGELGGWGEGKHPSTSTPLLICVICGCILDLMVEG